jgi:hypothetical protein
MEAADKCIERLSVGNREGSSSLEFCTVAHIVNAEAAAFSLCDLPARPCRRQKWSCPSGAPPAATRRNRMRADCGSLALRIGRDSRRAKVPMRPALANLIAHINSRFGH